MANYRSDRGFSAYDEEDVLSFYLKEINKVPLLTREEEDNYARLAKLGDEHAKKQLVQANLKFVVNTAKKYQNQGLPLADLVSEGNIGLINALEKYDVDRGYHFISYAVWWIRQAIMKAIYEKSRMIRLPLNRSNELVQIEKMRKNMQHDKGREPGIEEIAQGMKMKPKHVASIVNISRNLVSLETPIASDKENSQLRDFIEDKNGKDPKDQAVESALVDEINRVLATLSEKESGILQYRFGLNGYKPCSLKEIGDKYNLTKERIRQIERKAIKRLQHPSRCQQLASYIA